MSNSSGEIKFKGKSIETILVDGDNLFRKNYRLASKNINVHIIEEIEAIEKYSENRLLREIENSDKIALNLKLKSTSINASGTIEAGLGLLDKNKLAKNVNLNLFALQKKIKLFSGFQNNNLGVSNALIDFSKNNQNNEELQPLLPNLNSIVGNLNDKRTNINNEYFSNVNAIIDLSNKVEIFTEHFYTKDRIFLQKQIEQQLLREQEEFPINLKEKYTNYNHLTDYQGLFKINYFLNRNSQISLNTGLSLKNISFNPIVNTNYNGIVSLSKKNEYLKFHQELLLTKKLNKNTALQIIVHQNHQELPEKFKWHTNNEFFDQDISQQMNTFKITTLLLGKTNRKNKYKFSLNYHYNKSRLDRVLEKYSHQNYLSTNQFFNEGSYIFFYKSLSLHTKYKAVGLQRKTQETNAFFYIEPLVNFTYKFNRKSNIAYEFQERRRSLIEGRFFKSPIYTNIRNSFSNDLLDEIQKIQIHKFIYNYNNLFKQFQIHFSASHHATNKSFLTQNEITEDKHKTIVSSINAPTENFNLNFTISKYFKLIKSTVNIESHFLSGNQYNQVNGEPQDKTTLSSFEVKLKHKTRIFKKIRLSNSFQFLQFINKKTLDKNSITNSDLIFQSKLTFLPNRKLYIGCNFDQYINNIESKNNYINFLDFNLRYKPNKGKLEYNIQMKNILNNNIFRENRNTIFYTNNTRTSILPSSFLFNISYAF